MIPSSYRRSKYYKNKIYFNCNSPTCNGKGYSVNNLFTLTTACNDVCKYLTARREISGNQAGDGDRNVVISGVFLEEDQEPVSSNLNQVQEAGESVRGISGNQAGDGDRNVVISGVFLEEDQEPVSSNLNQVQEAGESVGGISGNQAGDGDRNVVIWDLFGRRSRTRFFQSQSSARGWGECWRNICQSGW
ncbi:uncharacterized protein LOC135929642 isoform X2 [Gordionus sp. m RMFG-2023]|uniref:uncharacterized protein LOC135929642 isoform X2 n=1 Tax=Gordionus sp. m RMFG-2023 TaxID=3053472 RepID=UPI0031FCA3D2